MGKNMSLCDRVIQISFVLSCKGGSSETDQMILLLEKCLLPFALLVLDFNTVVQQEFFLM